MYGWGHFAWHIRHGEWRADQFRRRYAHARTHTHTCTHTNKCTNTCTYTHAHTHTHTNTHTHTHTHRDWAKQSSLVFLNYAQHVCILLLICILLLLCLVFLNYAAPARFAQPMCVCLCVCACVCVCVCTCIHILDYHCYHWFFCSRLHLSWGTPEGRRGIWATSA